MRLQRTPPITLTKKKRRRLRTRHHYPREAEDESWQNWSSDSADSAQDAELTTNEIAVMSNEMEKILSEAGVPANNVCPVDTAQSTPSLQPHAAAALNKESKAKKANARVVPISKSATSSDAPFPPLSPLRVKQQRFARALYKAPPEPLEPVQATVLNDDLDPTLAYKQPSGIDAAMQQGQGISSFAEASGEAGTDGVRAPKKDLWESHSYRNYVPPPPFASAVPSPIAAGNRGCPWCLSEFRPTSPVVQRTGLVCDECKFTCAGCGRRSPDVKFTTYCAKCCRPNRPFRETHSTCQDGNVHRLHDQEDSYCNCTPGETSKRRPSGEGLKKVDGAVPFLYSTYRRPSTSLRPPRRQNVEGNHPNARRMWTANNATMPDSWASDSCDVSDSVQTIPSSNPSSACLVDTAESQPLYVTGDAHASFNWPSPLSQGSLDGGGRQRCPTCGYSEQQNACASSAPHHAPPQSNCCCCFDVPCSSAMMPIHQAPLAWLPEARPPQPTDFCRDHCPVLYHKLTLPPFCASAIRREETWTDGNAIRRIVLEETEPSGSLHQSISRASSATAPLTSVPSYSSVSSPPSAVPPFATHSASSWGRTLDFNPIIVSRRYSYVTCVPENRTWDRTGSATLLGGAFSFPSSDHLDKSGPSAPETASRKSSLKGSERRRSSSSAPHERKPSFVEPISSPIPASTNHVRKSDMEDPGQRSPFVFSVGRRKSSIKANTTRRSSATTAESRSAVHQDTKRRPSLSTKSFKKLSVTDTEPPFPLEPTTTSRKSSNATVPTHLSYVHSKAVCASGTQTERCRVSSMCVGTETPTRAEAEVQATERSVTKIAGKADAAFMTASNHTAPMLASKTHPKDESRSKVTENTASTHSYKSVPINDDASRSDKEKLVSKRKKSEQSALTYDTAPEKGEEQIAYTKDVRERSATSNRGGRSGQEVSLKKAESYTYGTPDKTTGNEDGAGAADESGDAQGSEHTAASPSPEEAAGVERSRRSDGRRSAEEQQDESGEEGEDASIPPPAEPPEPSGKDGEYDKKMAEEPLDELISSTRSLYPESRVVMALAMLCVLWVIVIIVLSSAAHTHILPFPTDHTHDVMPVTTESSSRAPYRPLTPEPRQPTTSPHPNAPASKVYACSTRYCESEGTYLKSLLSSQNNPCDNFYDYVCEIWKANVRPNIGMGFGAAVSRDTFIEEKMESEVVEYFRSDSQDVLLALQLFNACLRSTNQQPTEVKMALKDMFKEFIFGSWPIAPTDTAFNTLHVWSLAGTLYRQFGIDAFLGVSIGRHQTKYPLVVLELPRMLFLRNYEAYSMTAAMFQDAIREALKLSSSPNIAQEVASDVYTVFRDLSQRQPTEGEFKFNITKPHEIPEGLRTFLSAVFQGRMNTQAIAVRNPEFIFTQLENHVKFNDVPSLINYLGFRLIVRIAPFLPTNGFENLKMIFSAETTGRVRALPLHQNNLCLRAVEAALPICVVKAHAKIHLASGNDLNDRVWISQSESSFFRNVAKLYWVDDLTYMIIRFRMANTKLARFFPVWSLDSDQCNGSIVDYGTNTVLVYRNLFKKTMKMKLRQIDSLSSPRDAGSAFDTRSRYSWAQQAIYVPLGIINSSVPSNATLFAFHLSRVAVRFYHSLAPLLRQEPTSLGASYNLQYTNRSQTLFHELLTCLSRDLGNMLRQTRAEFDLDPYEAGYALLAQTVAVALAFVTFRELLHVERIWKLSFRLSTLPDLSSDQLFFVWFALDNCENSDPPYQIRQYQMWKRLPPDFAVNFPLRHLPHAFGEAFSCPPGSFMRPSGYTETCNIFNTTVKNHVLP